MKVLVISLLRLGDFVQTLPILNALKVQYPIRKLDVLVHEPVKALAPMVPDVNHWWTIDRDGLQEGLGRGEVPLLTSFSILKEQLDAINACKYDCIINLTQTHYSAWIAGYLNAGNRSGLTFDSKGIAHFHSPWFRYLDEHSPLDVKDVFHYTDIFFYGSGLKGPERNWVMRETRDGRREVAALALEEGEKIVLQVFTSDSKKNWSEDSWVAMLGQLQLFRPNAEFVLLCSPAEEARLEGLLARARDSGVSASKAVLSLEGALSLLNRASLLITGDTSIKHIANASAAPILELSLGSSDYRRTGAYKADSVILQGRTACAPCPHSSPCGQREHYCSQRISPEAVSTVAHHMMEHDRAGIQKLAKEFSDEVRILRSRQLASGFWYAEDLSEHNPEVMVEKLIERCTWKFLLNREYLNPLAQFGSEGVRLKQELDELLSHGDRARAFTHLGFLESEADKTRETLSHQIAATQARTKEELRAPGIVEIGGIRRLQNQLEHAYQQSQMKIKLIRSLKTQLTESL